MQYNVKTDLISITKHTEFKQILNENGLGGKQPRIVFYSSWEAENRLISARYENG